MHDYRCQNRTIIDGHFHRSSPGGFGQKVNLLITFFCLFRYVHPRFDLIELISNEIERFVYIFYINFSYSGIFVAILRNVFHIYKIISWIEISRFCLENYSSNNTMQNVEDATMLRSSHWMLLQNWIFRLFLSIYLYTRNGIPYWWTWKIKRKYCRRNWIWWISNWTVGKWISQDLKWCLWYTVLSLIYS